MNSKSFLSSSSTLAEGLDLMAAPMEDVVGKKFPLDDEEKELKLRLEAIPSLALIFSLTSLHTSSQTRRCRCQALNQGIFDAHRNAAPSTAQQTQEDQDKDLHFHAVFYGCSYIRDCYG
jgi:hypothetical protein